LKLVEDGLGIKGWLRGPKRKDIGPKAGEVVAGRERIAILPFVNISPDPKDEYFADGMTEELISTLSKIVRLKVISRTSVMRYKKTAKSVEEISKELNVGSILEGSVRKAADDLRITVKLIDVRRDEHVWSEDYERKVENVFAVQKEIARKVVDSLQVELLPGDKRSIEKQGTKNVEAYDLYLKGQFLWNKRSKEGMTEAIEYFRAAAQKDPLFALPHVGIADSYSLLVINSYLPAKDGYPHAEKAIARALELDKNLAEAHASLGLLRSDADWDWPASEREYRKAIVLNPNYATAHHWLSILLGPTLGRVDEGMAEAKKALELDPMSPVINVNLGYAYESIGKLDTAEQHARKALDIDPTFLIGFALLALVAVDRGSYGEAIDLIEKMASMYPAGLKAIRIGMACVYAKAGNLEKAKQIFDETAAVPGKDQVNALGLARYHAVIGDKDRAFDMLNRAFENHDTELCTLGAEPWLRDLATDPRFTELLKKMKLR
jgi:TolB-like protein/Tfp pilus assembly protein PilF